MSISSIQLKWDPNFIKFAELKKKNILRISALFLQTLGL